MPANVLVTGGAGYIGSHAVLALRDAGHAVTVIDDLSTGFRWAVPDGVGFHQGNVADGALIDRIVAAHGIEAVMHFAGSIIVPESVTDPLKYYRNNTAATRDLLESVVRNGIRHFIFSSTAAVYGAPERVPVDETTPRLPINPYGTSKLMTELMLADVAAAHPLNYAALRYFNVAGADPQARTGQSTAGATHLIKIAVEAALGKRLDQIDRRMARMERDTGIAIETLAVFIRFWLATAPALAEPAAQAARAKAGQRYDAFVLRAIHRHADLERAGA